MSTAAARTGPPRPTARATGRARATSAATAAPAVAPPTPSGGSLRLAPVPAGARPPLSRGPFVAAVLAVLAAGLLGLLLLNTALAQGSFHLHALQVQSKQLADREQSLQQDVDARQAPAALAAAAQAQGMVPGGPPAFLQLPSGKVLGEPAPAAAPTAPAPATPAAVQAPDVPRDATATSTPTPTPTGTAKSSSRPSASSSPTSGAAR